MRFHFDRGGINQSTRAGIGSLYDNLPLYAFSATVNLVFTITQQGDELFQDMRNGKIRHAPSDVGEGDRVCFVEDKQGGVRKVESLMG